MEAEEIARLAADLEQAVRTANAEAQRRRGAEDRLAAAERRLTRWKGSSDLGGRATDGRSLRSRSRSPPQSPCDRAGGRKGAAGAVEKFATKSGASEVRACAGGRAAAHAWGVGESIGGSPEREMKSLQPPERAMGSTIASRGRRSASDRIAGQKEESGGKGLSSGSPGGNKHRPRGASSPSPSRRRGDSSALSPSDQCTTGRSSRDSEPDHGSATRGHFSRRYPNGARTVAEEHRTVERCDPRRERRAIEGAKAPPLETQESPGAGRRRYSAGRRSVARDGVDRREPGPAGSVAAGAVTAGSRRERRADVVRHSKVDGPVTLGSGEVYAEEEARKGSGGGGQESMAETSVAITRGEELAETVARELRLAVATTSAASPASVAGFPAGATGGDTPSDYGTGSHERRHEKSGSRQREEDPFLLLGRKDGSKHADSVRNPGPSVPLSGDCGQSLKSREVAELESDVQHIFQFFSSARGFKAGQDGGISSSCRAGEEKGAEATEGDGEREEDYGSAIAKALALWGMTGEGESGR